MESMEDLKERMKKNNQEQKLKNRKKKFKEIIGNKRLNPTSNTDLAQKIEIEEEKEEIPFEPKKGYLPLYMHQKRNHHHSKKKKARSAGSVILGPTSRKIALS